MQAQRYSVVRSTVRSTRGQLENNVLQWRNDAGALAAEVLNSENDMAPELISPRRQFVLGSILVALAVLISAARHMGLV